MVPLNIIVLLDSAQIVPPSKYTELLVKLLVRLKSKVATVLCDVNIATPHCGGTIVCVVDEAVGSMQ